MVKLIRFITLVSESMFIQFTHMFGALAMLAAILMGYFRLPSWLVPILAVVFGVLADKYIDQSDMASALEKASAADKRGGFMIVVYFVIIAVGYVAGAYGRFYYGKKPAVAAPPAKTDKKG